MTEHSLVQLFENRAQLLDITGSAESLDQAPLSEDDVAVLGQIGVSSTAGVCAGGWTRRLPIEPVEFF